MSEQYHRVHHRRATENDVGQRFDNFIMSHYRSVPRSLIYKAIRKGSFRVNGKRVRAFYRLMLGDEVRVPPFHLKNEQRTYEGAWLEHAILYEDQDCMVLNKPSNVASQGGTGQSFSIIDGLRSIRKNDRLYLVHRLDKETSGCLLIAKKRATMVSLQQQFMNRSVEKIYWALVSGVWEIDDVIDRPLAKVGRKVQVLAEGKKSQTHFKTLAMGQDGHHHVTLVEAKLKTGRMHQIRVHAADQGHPIIGDALYGEKNDQGLMLHAKSLVFEIGGKKVACMAPMDEVKKQKIIACCQKGLPPSLSEL